MKKGGWILQVKELGYLLTFMNRKQKLSTPPAWL